MKNNLFWKSRVATVLLGTSLLSGIVQAVDFKWESLPSAGDADIYYVESFSGGWSSIGSTETTGVVYSGNETGVDWRKAFARQDLYPMGVAELGGSLFFAFEGAFGSSPILTRSGDGTQMSKLAFGEELASSSVGSIFSAGGRLYVSVSDEAGAVHIHSSSDGESWEPVDLPLQPGEIIWDAVEMGDSVVFAGGTEFESRPLLITRLADGNLVRKTPEGLEGSVISVAEANGRVAAVGGGFDAEGNESGFVLQSSNGSDWELVGNDFSGVVYGIASHADTFAIAGQGLLATSTDLQNWNHSPLEFGFLLFDIDDSDAGFMAMGANGVALLGTPDGSAPNVRLSTARRADSLEVSWPETGQSASLESSASVRGPFTESRLVPRPAGPGRIAVDVPTTDPRQFFRLRLRQQIE